MLVATPVRATALALMSYAVYKGGTAGEVDHAVPGDEEHWPKLPVGAGSCTNIRDEMLCECGLYLPHRDVCIDLLLPERSSD